MNLCGLETDGGASHALSKSDTDTTDEREGCVSDTSNNIPSCTIEVVNQAGDSHGHSFDAMTDKSFQKETGLDEPDYDLQEIKDYFSRSADLQSAPAVLFGSTQEKETEYPRPCRRCISFIPCVLQILHKGIELRWRRNAVCL